jgi:hypothetical protein
MATDSEKRWRWRFSLRGLLAAMVVVGVGLGLLMWWRAPIVERQYHKNGVVAKEVCRVRDWRGRQRLLKTVSYYSNGKIAFKSEEGKTLAGWDWIDSYWLPDGTKLTVMHMEYGTIEPSPWKVAQHSDNGDGTFRAID